MNNFFLFFLDICAMKSHYVEKYGTMWEIVVRQAPVFGFFGSYACTIDDKGRLSIPAKIRPGDPESAKRKGIPAVEQMMLTEGFDGCLMLLTKEGWEKYERIVTRKASMKRNIRYFMRRLYQNSSLVRIDRSGRITIPDKLREVAELGKDVLVVGVSQSIEIWNPERYQRYLDGYEQSYEEVAEEVAEEITKEAGGFDDDE
jgi:MraZ protein